MTARPARTPAAIMVLTSAATSLRMSCAILLPSKMVAGIQAPRKFYRNCREPPHHGAPWHGESRNNVFSPGFRVSMERTCAFHHCASPPMSYNAPVMLSKELLEILVCPACKQELEYRQNPETLKCKQCHRVYAVKDDIPIMLIDEATVEP